MHIRHLLAIILCAVLFSGCSFTEEPPMQTVKNAKNATIFAEYILQIFRRSSMPQRPAASLGVHVGRSIGHYPNPTIHGALYAIDILTLFFTEESTTDKDIAILQQLGNQLQINVIDMLNRSTDRAQALNQYTEHLRSLAEEVQNTLTRVRSQEKDLSSEIRMQKTRVNQLQRDINKQLIEQQFSVVGILQEELVRMRIELAEAEAHAQRMESIADTLEDLLSVAAKRLEAIAKNREALITGIKITELPGTAELGIIEKSNGKINSFRKPKSGLLDFSDL